MGEKRRWYLIALVFGIALGAGGISVLYEAKLTDVRSAGRAEVAFWQDSAAESAQRAVALEEQLNALCSNANRQFYESTKEYARTNEALLYETTNGMVNPASTAMGDLRDSLILLFQGCRWEPPPPCRETTYLIGRQCG